MANLGAYLLASWRLSRMLYDRTEAGPLSVLHWIRYWAGVEEESPGQLAEALVCPYCISVWVGLLFSLMSLNEKLFRITTWPFAASAVVVLYLEHLEPD